jgi:hypothetical protein
MNPQTKAAAPLNTGTATKDGNNEYAPLVASFRLPCKVYLNGRAENLACLAHGFLLAPDFRRWAGHYNCVCKRTAFFNGQDVACVERMTRYVRGQRRDLWFALSTRLPNGLQQGDWFAFRHLAFEKLIEAFERLEAVVIPGLAGCVIHDTAAVASEIVVSAPVRLAFDAPADLPRKPPFRLPGSADNTDTRKERCQ